MDSGELGEQAPSTKQVEGIQETLAGGTARLDRWWWVDSRNRSTSNTRYPNGIRGEGRKSVLKNEHGVHNYYE